MRRLALLASVATVAVAAAPAGAQPGQGRPCVPQFESPTGSPTTSIQLPSGQYNTYQGGGVLYRCVGQNVVIVADSLEAYGDLRQVILIGNVRYRDDDVTVTSMQMTWNEVEQWLLAQGDVNAVSADGSTMRGPFAEYYREIPVTRPVQRLRAVGRPTLQLVQTDSAGQRRPPVVVVANEINMLGDSLVYAGGQVEITRTDAIARGDSAYVDEQGGFARLMREPQIEGRGDRPFTLTGTVIDLFTRERQLERVLSKGDARSRSEDVDLRADTLDLRLAAGELQSAVAWGPTRARATSTRQDIEADSLDVRMPGQRLREVFAIGAARLESDPDSTAIRSTERDWLMGDTVIARFDTLAASDSGSPPIRSLVAMVEARSFQQIAPDTGITEKPSIHYVRGRRIDVAFEPGEGPRRVTVVAPDTGQTVGIYLDATGAAATPPAGQQTAPGSPPPSPPPAGSAAPASGGRPPQPTRPAGTRPPR